MQMKWMVVGLAMFAFVVAGCSESSSKTNQSSSGITTPSSNGGKTYGPACQRNFDSAACVEEQEAKAKVAEKESQERQQQAMNQENAETVKAEEKEAQAQEEYEKEQEKEGNPP